MPACVSNGNSPPTSRFTRRWLPERFPSEAICYMRDGMRLMTQTIRISGPAV
jgi:hypothetical protein